MPEAPEGPQQDEPQQPGPELPPIAGAPRQAEEVVLRAREQEKSGDLYTLRGDVEILFRTFTLRADQITYDAASGQVTATGNLRFEGGPNDEYLQASRGTYNVRTETGRFYDVLGTTGARLEGDRVLLTSSNPFIFTGRMVEKTSPTRYIVHDGSVTTCRLPDPIWTFSAQRVVVDAGQNAHVYHSTFRIKNVPIFYFPYAAHPVERLGRQSGFLIPNIGQSSRKGLVLGESFYWAINRSMDATLGAEYYSSRGWGQQGQFRARPSADSYLNFNFVGVSDRGFGPQRVDQGGQDVRLDGEALLPRHFRGVASLNYLSSFIFRLAFTEAFSQAVNSEVKSVAFVSRSQGGWSFNTMGRRYQNFQSTARGDLITIVHSPSVDLSTVDKPVGNTRLYWGLESSVGGLSRREPGFKTDDFVGRIDVRPRASLPLFLSGWSFRPEVALRNTYYTQRRVEVSGMGVPVDDPVNRRAFESSFEVRPPALSRVFDREVLGRNIKHTIEQRFTYRYVTGVENFPSILRFDAGDILSNTNELEYAVVNRIYTRRRQPLDCKDRDLLGRAAECGNSSREWLSWELRQKYFLDDDFGGALVNGKRNVFTTSAGFTGIAFLTAPRRFSPLVSKLRIHASKDIDIDWQLDYDVKEDRVNASTAFVNYRIGDWYLGGSHAFLQASGEIFPTLPLPAPTRFNQFRALVGYGHPNKLGWNAATNVGFDATLDFLQYAAFQGSYNWDCCGVSVEYRRFALGAVRNENQVRFAFSLTNIGTFGNLRRQERLF